MKLSLTLILSCFIGLVYGGETIGHDCADRDYFIDWFGIRFWNQFFEKSTI